MKQSIGRVALGVRDYDEAIAFYTKKLNFDLIANISCRLIANAASMRVKHEQIASITQQLSTQIPQS